MLKKIFLVLCLLLLYVYHEGTAFASGWLQEKSDHFAVFYSYKEDSQTARKILRQAEKYYRSIASQIGYSRYTNFWTWNERVKIIIFKNQKQFAEKTGQPLWSRGYSSSHSKLFQSRLIVTYRQEEDFIKGLLPHEISHLILRDFIGFDKPIPVWFDEGVAQLQQESRLIMARQLMKSVVKQNRQLPLKTLFSMNVYQQNNQDIVALFYAQSVSIVEFLITKYGRSAFKRLCRQLRDGRNFEEALRIAYPSGAKSIEELQQRWSNYLLH